MNEADSSLPESLPEEWRRAFSWIERELGGRIVRAERQPRWRPAWFLDLERDGEIVPLYFRGDRGETDHGIYPLDHEMRVLQVLEKHGIPVPHVYGFCPDPRGIVMERGRGRSNLATSDDPEERVSVLDHYMEILARMHAIDIAPFEAIGLERPADPDRLALDDFAHWERAYRQAKRRPEPLIEFVIQWLHRNVPRGRTKVSFLAGDSGQFLFENGRVTAVLDLELAHLGDPAADIGALRSRTLTEPLGDLSRAVRRYNEISGASIDLATIDYHTVRFALCTPMAVAAVVAAPPEGTDLVQYLAWYVVYSRVPLEVIAHCMGIALEPIEMPEPAPTRHSPSHDALVSLLAPDPSAGAFTAYRIDAAWRIAEYLRRVDLFGPACEAMDLDEAARLLGHRPSSWHEADAAFERLVAESGPERDADFVRFFHRRIQRQEAILRPVMRELEDATCEMLI